MRVGGKHNYRSKVKKPTTAQYLFVVFLQSTMSRLSKEVKVKFKEEDEEGLGEGEEKGRVRVACHRCGNIRTGKIFSCANASCLYVFCDKCKTKFESKDTGSFTDGCPKCLSLCCCGINKSLTCTRPFHCYMVCLFQNKIILCIYKKLTSF